MRIDLTIDKEKVLELHKKNKTKKMVIQEQQGDIYAKLQAFIDKGQVPDAESIAELRTTLPDRKYAIKKKSVKYKGKYVYLFHDFKWGMYDDNGKFVFGEGEWTPKPAAEDIRKKTNLTQDITKSGEEGWKTEDEWRKLGVNWNYADKLFDKKQIGNVTLYKYKKDKDIFTPNVTGDAKFTEQEQQFIDDLEQKGYILNPTPLEKKTLTPITAEKLGAGADLFPNGLIVWYNPSTQKDVDKKTSLLSDILNNQEINREACRKNVKDFYEAFKVRTVIDPAQMTKVKQVVQACNNQYYSQWGAFGGGNKLDYMLDVLTGVREGGPLKRDAFRLEKARNIKY